MSEQRQISDAEDLSWRIQNYFNNGGYFNPESMDHEKVRVMLLDIRKYLYADYKRALYGLSPNEVELGLNVDMTDVDRLNEWARLIETFGPDITQWGQVAFVVGRLRDLAERLDKEVREVGALRKLVADSERTPLRIDRVPVAPDAPQADGNADTSSDLASFRASLLALRDKWNRTATVEREAATPAMQKRDLRGYDLLHESADTYEICANELQILLTGGQ